MSDRIRTKKLGKNVALITIGNFASKLMSFLFVPVYTAVLSTQEYGTADLITTTVSLLLPFFTLIISEAVMRFALDQNNDRKQIFMSGLAVTSAGCAAMLLFSPVILLFDDLSPFYILFVLYFISSAFHDFLAQFVKGIEKVAVFSLSGIFQTFSFISLNILFLVVMHLGIDGYLYSMIISSIISSIILAAGGKV